MMSGVSENNLKYIWNNELKKYFLMKKIFRKIFFHHHLGLRNRAFGAFLRIFLLLKPDIAIKVGFGPKPVLSSHPAYKN